MQGWESECGWVGGIPVIENEHKVKRFKINWLNSYKTPNSCFLKAIWSHIQDFPKRRIFWIFGTRIFRYFQSSRFGEFSQHNISQKRVGSFLDLPCCIQSWSNWCWGAWARPLGPRIMKIMTFLVFGKWNLKVTSPKRSGIILPSFWAIKNLKFTIQMVPPNPPRPQNRDFSHIPYEPKTKSYRSQRGAHIPYRDSEVGWKPRTKRAAHLLMVRSPVLGGALVKLFCQPRF